MCCRDVRQKPAEFSAYGVGPDHDAGMCRASTILVPCRRLAAVRPCGKVGARNDGNSPTMETIMNNAHRIRSLGHTDQGGRPDGVQVMVVGNHAYVGHMFSDVHVIHAASYLRAMKARAKPKPAVD